MRGYTRSGPERIARRKSGVKPHQYALVLSSPGEIELAAVAGRELQRVPAGWDGAEPGEQYVYVENPVALRVVGDLDGAAALSCFILPACTRRMVWRW